MPSNRILVIEDDPDLANLFHDILEEEGYRVVAARGPLDSVLLPNSAPDSSSLISILGVEDGSTATVAGHSWRTRHSRPRLHGSFPSLPGCDQLFTRTRSRRDSQALRAQRFSRARGRVRASGSRGPRSNSTVTADEKTLVDVPVTRASASRCFPLEGVNSAGSPQPGVGTSHRCRVRTPCLWNFTVLHSPLDPSGSAAGWPRSWLAPCSMPAP